MATTTPNFGWPVPTSTDLVKDGATAMEALGDAIDTSMVDLKGGTTGQVLAKASNTDMDFSWVAQDDSNAIQNTIVDAKGDLIAASAADTPARLAVGSNGETLVADSSTATGLRWNPSYVSGKNFLVNGGMDCWQRGTTLSFGAFNPQYLADRWYCFVATANNTLSQETTTVPTGARYALKWTSTGAGGTYGIYQVIETANTIPLAGKTVTIQAQVTGTTGKTAAIYLYSSTSVDAVGTTISTVVGNSTNVTLTSGTYSTVSVTVAVPSTVKTLKVGLISGDTFANTEYVTMGNVQLEVGSVATLFSRAGSTIAGELALCQRYYYRTTAGALFGYFSAGNNYGTTTNYSLLNLPVTLRTAPASIETTGTASNYRLAGGGVATACSVVPALDQTGTNQISILSTVASGLTVGYAASLGANNTTSAYIGVSAEL